METEKFGEGKGMPPALIAEQKSSMLDTQMDNLSNKTHGEKEFYEMKKSHENSIAEVHQFLKKFKKYGDEQWHRTCVMKLVTYETLFLITMFDHINNALKEVNWGEQKSEQMKKIRQEILNIHIPRFTGYDHPGMIAELNSIAMAIEMKIKADK